MQLDEEA